LFQGATCKYYTGNLDPLIIEALALRYAFMYVVVQGLGHVIFEIDCGKLVRHWQNRLEERCEIRPIVDENVVLVYL
jgi:hypothetical protein